jgi:hypothetical protein
VRLGFEVSKLTMQVGCVGEEQLGRMLSLFKLGGQVELWEGSSGTRRGDFGTFHILLQHFGGADEAEASAEVPGVCGRLPHVVQ